MPRPAQILRRILIVFGAFGAIIAINRSWRATSGTLQESELSASRAQQLFAKQAIFTESQNLTRDCSRWSRPDIVTSPQIVLDPDRFLYPGLIWGPNNQIAGFAESIYLAIRLNRTLVIPPFYSHDSTIRRKLEAHERVDLARLCSFVSCVTIEQMRESCRGSFDVALQAMVVGAGDLQRFEAETGMKLQRVENPKWIAGSARLRVGGRIFSNVPSLPRSNYSIAFKARPIFPSDRAGLLALFGTSARCAIYASPFYTIPFHMKNDVAVPLDPSVSDVTKVEDRVLASAVAAALRFPPGVAAAAGDYVGEVLGGGRFVAAHWRYNDEWLKSQCTPYLKKLRPDLFPRICGAVPMISPFGLARRMAQVVAPRLPPFTGPVFVYFATPPSQQSFKDRVIAEMTKINAVFTAPPRGLVSFLEEDYATCWRGWASKDDVISMTEMEVVRRSEWFFHSTGSTWSRTVRPLRTMRHYDETVRKFEQSVLDFAWPDSVQR